MPLFALLEAFLGEKRGKDCLSAEKSCTFREKSVILCWLNQRKTGMKTDEMLFRTTVEVPKWTFPMQAQHHFVLLGSCFAQNIGEVFESYDLSVVCNPLGVTYNPASIAIQVQQALERDKVTLPSSFFHLDGSWGCWWASTQFSDTDEEKFLSGIQQTFTGLGEALREADFLFVTLGSNVCYRLKENEMIVTNCHKKPHRIFDEVRLNQDACIETLCDMMELLKKECPKLRVVFTVSPYRYRKYGFHGSQLAKATLLLAVEKVCELYPEKTIYFPAYEILLDELRDYRFYNDDMIHPAPAAVNYIWQRMVESCMDEGMQKYLKDYEPIRRRKMHKNL